MSGIKFKGSSDAFGAFLWLTVIGVIFWLFFGRHLPDIWFEYFNKDYIEGTAVVSEKNYSSLTFEFHDKFRDQRMTFKRPYNQYNMSELQVGETVDIKYFKDRPEVLLVKQFKEYPSIFLILLLTGIMIFHTVAATFFLIKSIQLSLKENQRDRIKKS